MSFPTSPNDNQTYFDSNQLYKYNSTDNSWYKINDIIPTNHWKLQETAGATVNDSGLNPLALTNSNATVNQTGKIDKAYSFNGSSSKLTLPSVIESSSSGSISAWIYLNSVSDDVRIILSESDGTTTEYFRFYNYGTDLRFNLRDNGSFIGSVQAESSLSLNTWHHIVITADGNEYKLYVDGVSKTLSAIDGTLLNTGDWTNSISVDEAYIGVFNDSSAYFDGLIEDVRYYNYTLSKQEIATIYNAGLGTHSQELLKSYPTYQLPINHWKLQEESGTTVNDAMNNLVLTNSNATINQTGHIDKAYSFNGTSSRLRTTSVRTDSVGSYSAWVYRENTGTFQSFYSSCRDNSEFYNFNIAKTTDNKLTLFIRENTILSYLTSTNSIPINQWSHIAITSDGSQSKLYINGIEEIITVVNGTNGGFWLSDVTNRVNTNIGRTERQTITDYFDGLIEDVRLYDYALSEQEILNLYNNGKGLLITN